MDSSLSVPPKMVRSLMAAEVVRYFNTLFQFCILKNALCPAIMEKLCHVYNST